MTEQNRPDVHWVNPWPEAIPVPLEELAACVAGGTVRTVSGAVKDYTVPYVLEEWRRYGERLDGYLLVGGESGHISVGVRFGADGPEYLSPYCQHKDIARDLVAKYGPATDVVALAP